MLDAAETKSSLVEWLAVGSVVALVMRAGQIADGLERNVTIY